MSLSAVFAALGLSQRDVAREAQLSQPAISRIAAGVWPKRGAAQARQRLDACLRARGATPVQLLTLFTPTRKEVGPDELQLAEAAPEVENQPETPEEETMLLANQSLSPEARKHFGLPRNPFVDDVQSPDDVYQTPSVRYVRAALTDCAQHHGFLAVVGESGAGKSTLAEDLEERIKTDGRDVVVTGATQ